MSQDAFEQIERSLHETKVRAKLEAGCGCACPIQDPGLPLETVLELMAWAAAEARKVHKPGSKKAKPKEPPPPDPTPVIVTLPVIGGGGCDIHESLLPELRASYPSLNIESELHRIALEWRTTPGYQPTSRGAWRSLGFWLRKAQERAQASVAVRARPGGGFQDERQGGAATARLARAQEEAAEQRRRQEAERRGKEKPGSSPVATVIDGLFAKRGGRPRNT